MSKYHPSVRASQNRVSLYDEITGRIIAELEAGHVPWVQPWDAAAGTVPLAMPENAASHRQYSGVNILILWSAARERRFSSQRWLTYRQALAIGGHVRKGEEGTTVVYADRFIPSDEKRRVSETGEEAQAVAFLKRFTVFNTDQCVLPAEIVTTAPPRRPGMIEPALEALIRTSGIDFRIGGNRAFYAPSQDYVQVPPPAAFFEPINWHRTALHELGHASGHASRLDRDLGGSFDTKRYAFEELIAELCAAFCCTSLGIAPTVRHADYIGSWLEVLREDSRPTTLYLVVPPSDISRTKPLIRLVLNQIGRRLTEDLHSRDSRHRVLMMLDEFPALGRLDFFESALAFMAGYGIKSFLIAQSLNQIEKAYGPNNAILDNCHVRVSFAANDERTAKRVSDALGTATEMRAMKNYAGHRLNPWLGHLMVSRQETARPLLTPGEVMQLPPMDEIVMVAGAPPIRAKKVRYYEDRRFTERVLSPPDPARAGLSSRTDGWSTLGTRRPVSLPTDGGQGEEDTANSGLRREPELPDHVAIVKETIEPTPAEEFAAVLDDDEDAVRQSRLIRQQMRGVARQVTMDPNDGMEL